ncbi:hypothetical protein NAT69_05265 [Pseudomonas stutzeri]|uniref:hypothetical protein n=1 Tax=Stutzerimonas stutzeri subgroup TaxID=578833 RepID=UPI000CE4E512|nr:MULTISPECIES: hypothetical protein [Stutzerimonas stutzeri subgroup]MCQ4290626.1 hypothetical protein [Stutzerimonas stutzeri]
MQKLSVSLRFLPLQLGVAYLLFTIVLFFFGPFEWPIRNDVLVLFFLFVTLVALCLGYMLGSYAQSPSGSLAGWRRFFRLGVLLSIFLLAPSTYAYTGKWPWEVVNTLGDQGLAYREMLNALEQNESGIRSYVALGRAMAAPFVYCVIPFAILNWRSLSFFDVLLLLGHIAAILIFSLMRGTDRETGDLLVISLVSFLILGGQAVVRHGRIPLGFGKILASTLFLLMVFFLTIGLFVERKEARMGGDSEFCIAEGVVCSQRTSVNDPFISKLSFTTEMLSAYLAQGYYGLSLALKEDFTSTLGLGHSSFLIATFSKVVDESLYERSYLHKVDQAGWSDKAQWSTMFTWIASDVSFPMVPLVIAVLSFLWGNAWKSAVLWRSEAGGLVFLLLCLSILYMPANNQLTQTLDSYFAFVFWLVVWIGQGRSEKTIAEV